MLQTTSSFFPSYISPVSTSVCLPALSVLVVQPGEAESPRGRLNRDANGKLGFVSFDCRCGQAGMLWPLTQ